jgi:hypothetical protein
MKKKILDLTTGVILSLKLLEEERSTPPRSTRVGGLQAPVATSKKQ